MRKYDHITSVIKSLYSLKIDDKSSFKKALQMYKCLSYEVLAYLICDLVPVASLSEKQRLRSAKSNDVVANKCNLESSN